MRLRLNNSVTSIKAKTHIKVENEGGKTTDKRKHPASLTAALIKSISEIIKSKKKKKKKIDQSEHAKTSC